MKTSREFLRLQLGPTTVVFVEYPNGSADWFCQPRPRSDRFNAITEYLLAEGWIAEIFGEQADEQADEVDA